MFLQCDSIFFGGSISEDIASTAPGDAEPRAFRFLNNLSKSFLEDRLLVDPILIRAFIKSVI